MEIKVNEGKIQLPRLRTRNLGDDAYSSLTVRGQGISTNSRTVECSKMKHMHMHMLYLKKKNYSKKIIIKRKSVILPCVYSTNTKSVTISHDDPTQVDNSYSQIKVNNTNELVKKYIYSPQEGQCQMMKKKHQVSKALSGQICLSSLLPDNGSNNNDSHCRYSIKMVEKNGEGVYEYDTTEDCENNNNHKSATERAVKLKNIQAYHIVEKIQMEKKKSHKKSLSSMDQCQYKANEDILRISKDGNNYYHIRLNDILNKLKKS